VAHVTYQETTIANLFAAIQLIISELKNRF